MIKSYIQINQIFRDMIGRAWDGQEAYFMDDENYMIGTIIDYLVSDVRKLRNLWPEGLAKETLDSLEESIRKEDGKTFYTIRSKVGEVEDAMDGFFSHQPANAIPSNIIDFLDPRIVRSSYVQFRSGLFRDSVFNAFVTVFDLIREKTKIDKDGADLIVDVFSLAEPKLIFSSLNSESGKNEQKGFIQILQGAYLGIRNPKAHSLETDLNESKTIQYLVFASLLARRVDEARKVKKTTQLSSAKL